MAATTAGALKAWIESGGLGLAVYRDAAPRSATGEHPPLPYVTVRERIALTYRPDGTYDRDVEHALTETVQVDLWQRWRDEHGRVAEDYLLPDALARRLHGASGLPPAPGRIYGVRVAARARLLEEDENVVHDVVTVFVEREW